MYTSFDTELNADAVEFCPVPGLRDLLICGTYQLQESETGGRAEDQTRIGRLYALKLSQEEHETSETAPETDDQPTTNHDDGPRIEIPTRPKLKLTEDFRLDCPGVFDIKFSANPLRDGCALLGHAAADGSLYTYTIDDDDAAAPPARRIQRLSGVDCRAPGASAGALALSLDWNDRFAGGGGGGGGAAEGAAAAAAGLAAAVSLSDGSLCVVDVAPDGTLQVRDQWKGHELEAWVAAWDGHDPTGLYSGADEALLKGWDMRQGGGSATFTSNCHDAGVCCIQKSLGNQHWLATGSYDEYIRVFDLRSPRRPVAQHHAAGGVWRLKCHPVQQDLMLAACMHGGFLVIRYDHSRGTFLEDEMARFHGDHKSLAYGADWQWPITDSDKGTGSHSARPATPRGGAGRLVAASASFYDRLMHVWPVVTWPSPARPGPA